MEQRAQIKDDNTPKLNGDGSPRTEAFCAIAVPKGPEASWKDTPWGIKVVQAATEHFKNGEEGHPEFKWKVDDGDSTVPNKRMKKPCEREGWPGHWVVKTTASGFMPCKTYVKPKYDAELMDKNVINPGDYCRVIISCKANGSTQSPGVYMNLQLYSHESKGAKIVTSSGPVAAEKFGAAPAAPVPAVPAAAPAAPVPAVPAAAPPPPAAPDFLAAAPPPPAEEKYMNNGVVNTKTQLLAAGWTEAQIATLPKA